jgi:hypothetical protein
MPIILATWEAEIGKIKFKASSGEEVDKIPVSTNKS